MSGAGERQPPPAVPSLRTAVLLVLAALGAAAALLLVSTWTGDPSPGSPTSSPTPATTPPGRAAGAVTCSAPPPTPATVPHLASAPAPAIAAGARWRATLTTTCGVIRLELDGAAAPATVASFVTLARSGYWSDSVCHRLTTRQAATGFLQCGDPTGRSLGDPGYGLPLENAPPGGHYVRGMVGMARGDDVRGTAGEFLMVHRDFTVTAGAPVYSVFGRVVEGQEIIDHIAAQGGEDTRPDAPPFTSISVLTVSVVRD
ncbi:peptidyl-prolyl cis-trans isomerase B (cyclophilin B) [Humibacillus xanthopallidus]|uniref:Peptidyl-prolyl cis-trans isomerase B (Cyclophilin B) n=1 Tax=Humibacillus xanthopallidus TaxID=412689 RepID=A0A543PTE5_9MICO|nr:peptidylprolyl isomerase [Humibacillus xanthopallidus]TQN47352.1 peptidyl-prolyl cis-trans isomerase B (cyclophilin B) [Humibacillus xanthopallidus]